MPKILSAKEAEVLACMEVRADLPIAKVKKETGYREHTIRYALHRMESRGLIRFAPFINFNALGVREHNVYFSIATQSQKLREQILRYMYAHKKIIWVGELGGSFQYGLGICGRFLNEVQEVLYELSEKFGNVFFEKFVSSQYRFTIYPRRYLSAKKYLLQPLSVKQVVEKMQIDELDDRILSTLAAFGNISHRQLALKLGVPLSTFELRVRKLREHGVIVGYFYDVDLSKLRIQHYKLLLFGRGVSVKLAKRVREFAAQAPNVVLVVECFGSWDFELGVEVTAPQDIVRITQQLYALFGDEINKIEVVPKFRDLKYVPYPSDVIREGISAETLANLRR